ncbi:MAG: ribonuclease P protein component [Bacteroidales bacterium]|nr:ribonuclease P protein component [Bacteroidales bacterium]
MAQTFTKAERLCAKNDIDGLLKEGRYFSVDGVFRICARPRMALAPAGLPSRLLISVPKRSFKRAVKRNLLKRRIREAYRRHKPAVAVDLMLVYLPKEVLSYAEIEAGVVAAIARVEEALCA